MDKKFKIEYMSDIEKGWNGWKNLFYIYSNSELTYTVLSLDRSVTIDDLVSELLNVSVLKEYPPSHKTARLILNNYMEKLNTHKRKKIKSDLSLDTDLDMTVSTENTSLFRVYIDSMKNDDKLLIYMRFFENLSYNEMADELNVDEKTIRRWLGKLIKKIKTEFKD